MLATRLCLVSNARSSDRLLENSAAIHAADNCNTDKRTRAMPTNYGHKTFDTGKRDQHGFPVLRHEPLTKADAEALWEAAKAAEKDRAERMPDEKAAINAMFQAWVRLKELGWREAMYCPKDGHHFRVIENGSTGIFDCAYTGDWPDGHWHTFDEHDCYSSSIAPALFRLYPEDEEKRKAKMAEARERLSASQTPMEYSTGNRKYPREEDCEDNDEGA